MFDMAPGRGDDLRKGIPEVSQIRLKFFGDRRWTATRFGMKSGNSARTGGRAVIPPKRNRSFNVPMTPNCTRSAASSNASSTDSKQFRRVATRYDSCSQTSWGSVARRPDARSIVKASATRARQRRCDYRMIGWSAANRDNWIGAANSAPASPTRPPRGPMIAACKRPAHTTRRSHDAGSAERRTRRVKASLADGSTAAT
jgi:hypothetical protein